MMNVHPGRVRPQNRVDTPSDKRGSQTASVFTAPIAGLVTNTPLATPPRQSAYLLDNFWPTRTGIEPRGGTARHGVIESGVKSLFQYQTEFFACSDTDIYAFDSEASEARLKSVVSGQTGADYAVLERQTDGGAFLLAVNGLDPMLIYDGASWQRVTDDSAPFALTAVETDRLSHLWNYRNRVFFIEKNTMNAWYLGVNSVAGEARRLPLGGLFNKGGVLLFGATWSSDSGSGIDDRCVFATSEGEFALFSGGNPADLNDWRSDGVFDIGAPLGKNAVIQIGGDLIIATKAGLIPLSAATAKDPSQLKLDALSRAIEPDWRREVTLGSSVQTWKLVKWDSRNMALAVPPPRGADDALAFAVNLETGAWTRFTGWQIGAIAVLDDRLYYGGPDGVIYQCDRGGFDDGRAFECRACFSFDLLGAFGRLKTAHAIKGTWRSRTPFKPRHSVAKDYKASFPAAPSAPLINTALDARWDVSEWDEALWAEAQDDYQIDEFWESVSAHGESLAPQIQVTSAQAAKLDCELISIDLTYSIGAGLA